ncbi:hypothetical protein BDW74DRAFT_52753 [Aspergillus multicolor]|uniref:uncharacterized protein n=1 Tax=Aspergillus multicolor TaxID=41759 RepID=UPI003CCCE97A
MNILVEDISGSGFFHENNRCAKKEKRKDTSRPLPAAADSKPTKLSMDEIFARAQDQKSFVEDYLELCRTECAFLAPVINTSRSYLQAAFLRQGLSQSTAPISRVLRAISCSTLLTA